MLLIASKPVVTVIRQASAREEGIRFFQFFHAIQSTWCSPEQQDLGIASFKEEDCVKQHLKEEDTHRGGLIHRSFQSYFHRLR